MKFNNIVRWLQGLIGSCEKDKLVTIRGNYEPV